ncbi:MAG: N-acetylmuramoyl-L-alanine amidase [Paraclostridium sp.]
MFNINNIQEKSNITSEQLEKSINEIRLDNGFDGVWSSFLKAEKDYNINAIVLCAIACLESGYGTSKLATEKNNLFGLDAPTELQGQANYGSGYKSKEDCINYCGHRLGKQYLELDNSAKWRYCNGKKDLATIGTKWSESKDWANKVENIAMRIEKNIKEKKNMKINIHAGHNPDGKVACGAVGLIKESTENRKVKDEVVRLLKSKGHTVYDCTVNDGTNSNDVLTKIVKKCNANKVDLDVSIHFNAGANDKNGNGVTTGCEVYGYNTNTKAIGDRINSKINTLGFRNRGFKVNSSLYVLKNTTAPAILVECCFVDDKDDVNAYNYKTMAKAIAEGILNTTIVEETPKTEGETFYRVVVGSYKDRANANAMITKLKASGFDGFVDIYVKQ